MAAIAGKFARIKFTAATATSSTDNAATLAVGGLSCTIDSTSLRPWNRNNSTALRVFRGGVVQSSTGYSVQWPLGQVTFGAAKTTGVWTIDCESMTASALGAAQSWQLNVNTELLDVTSFSTGGVGAETAWRTFVPGVNSATVTIGKLMTTGSTAPVFIDRQAVQTDLIIDLITDSTGVDKFTGYCFVETDAHETVVEALAKENVTLRIDGPVYWSTQA